MLYLKAKQDICNSASLSFFKSSLKQYQSILTTKSVIIIFNLACYFFSCEMSIDRFPSIRFIIVSTVIVSTVSHMSDSTAMRKTYSISPMVSAKAFSL